MVKDTSLRINKRQHNYAIIALTFIFFLWGFITSLNDLLIPTFREMFQLSYTEVTVRVQVAFFTAFFLIALIYFLLSYYKQDPIEQFGYKRLIVVGLITTGVGCSIFYPAADLQNYNLFLGALFVMASGITILQIVANPYVVKIGRRENAAGRLSMTQAFNGFGTTLAPLIGVSFFIESSLYEETSSNVEDPYIIISGVLFLVAIIIGLLKLPNVRFSNSNKDSVLNHPHLLLGVLAIFMYVGAEVSISSYMVNYLEQDAVLHLSQKEASKLLALYWAGAMLGRFLGALFFAKIELERKFFFIAAIGILSYILAYFITGRQSGLAIIFTGLVFTNIIAFVIGKGSPKRTLGVFATLCILSLIIVMNIDGYLSMWALISIGLFNSVMFPTIFVLSLRDVKHITGQASSLLIMAIVGGAVIPFGQGKLASITGNLHLSYILPLLCYMYIIFYAYTEFRRSRNELMNK